MLTIFRINWLNLKRDKIALGLTFVLPIIFFSIFAVIFGGMGGGSAMRKVKVLVVDEDKTDASHRFIQGLRKEGSLEISLARTKPLRLWTRSIASDAVRQGDAPVAVIIPAGFAETFGNFGFGDEDSKPVELLYDEANQLAPQMVAGLMQRAAMVAAPDLMINRGLEMFERYAGGLTQQQREVMNDFLPRIRGEVGDEDNDERDDASEGGGETPDDVAARFTGPVQVRMSGIRSEDQEQRNSIIAFYAAGIGVMFLLFSMAGAGGTLLEEEESGALERLLNSRLGMTGLLLSKWLFLALMGALQVTIMFIWGWMAFGLELWTVKHVSGFLVMTAVTAAAAAGFGMMLATACRSRAQLGGVSTIVILIMSAVGGSMIPRFLLAQNPAMDVAGLFTFNAWALDGYHKVFWFELATDSLAESLLRLWPQVLVLAGLTVAFLLTARLLARRWETA